MKPHQIRYISLSLTPHVGSDDALLAVRVIPAGQSGRIVYARTIQPGESDSGEVVTYFPYIGEEVHFRPGDLQVSLLDVDRRGVQEENGYVPIANTLWTWLYFGEAPDPALFRYVFAAARRLDASHKLWADVVSALDQREDGFIWARQRLFETLGQAEMLCVGFSRVIDMLNRLRSIFSLEIQVPELVTNALPGLRAIRNAFEHIEDRALGNVRGGAHPDALTIFNQPDFVAHGILRYAEHSLDLRQELPLLLVAARRYIFQVANLVGGPARRLNVNVAFPAAPPGEFDRIKQRAYLLWKDRTGSRWWDAESNWDEAERHR